MKESIDRIIQLNYVRIPPEELSHTLQFYIDIHDYSLMLYLFRRRYMLCMYFSSKTGLNKIKNLYLIDIIMYNMISFNHT